MTLDARLAYDVARARITAGRGAAPRHPILLNSLPKAGTHLAVKLLKAVPGVTHIRVQLSSMTAWRFAAHAGERTLPLGIVTPVDVSERSVSRVLSSIPPGAFIEAHAPPSDALSDILRANGYRVVVMVRDPRDVALSAAEYLLDRRGHALHERFAELDQEGRLLLSITGADDQDGKMGMVGIRERVLAVMAWMDHPHVLAVRFEDLVGEQGGGSREAQEAAVAAICRHVGAPQEPVTIRSLAAGLFGGTATFRRGTIERWRREYTPAHVAAAQPLLDDILAQLGYDQDWHLER